MKKIILALMVLVTMTSFSALAQDKIDVIMEDETLVFDAEPVIVNNRTMVPMRTIFEELGATVKWSAEKRRVEALFLDGTHIMLHIDKDIAYKNGTAVEIDSAPYIQNDRTMVPVRFISEASGAGVGWNAETRTVTIVPVWRKSDFLPFSDNMDVPSPGTADRKMKITDGKKEGSASVYTYDISAVTPESVAKYEQLLVKFGFVGKIGTATDAEKAFYNGSKVVKTSLDGDTYVVTVYSDSTGATLE